MKKKLMLLGLAFMMTLAGHAQFEEGKVYAGASLSGLDLNYSGKDGFNIGVDAKVGYLFTDNWMLYGQASFQHSGNDDIADYASVGAGFRYYIIQNGLYLGLGAKMLHANHSYNDLMPELELGYAFFISHSATIEPAVYYDQSFRNHSDYSKIGFRVGFGIYL